MSRQKGQSIGGREAIVEAAERLFAAKGYAATTVRDILRAAGVTAPVLYYHFGNKEGVFLELLRSGMARIDAALDAVPRDGSAAGRLRDLCRTLARLRCELAGTTRLVTSVLAGPPDAVPPFDYFASARKAADLFEALVAEGVASGEFRPCDLPATALLFIGVIEALTRQDVFGRGGAPLEQRLAAMLDVVFEGLRPHLAAPEPAS